MTLDYLDRGYFKVAEVKIICGISPVTDGSMLVIGHLNSFDDLYLQEDEKPNGVIRIFVLLLKIEFLVFYYSSGVFSLSMC